MMVNQAGQITATFWQNMHERSSTFDIKTGKYLEANEHKSEGFYASTYINNTSRHHPHGQTRPCLPVHWSS